MKYSRQREALLDILRSTDSHPSADILYDELRKEFPNVSLATVYRNLTKLKANGDVIRVCTNDGKEHFDGTTSYHSHFVCNSCKRIYDIVMNESAKLNEAVENQLNACVDSHELTFYGICKECKKL